MGRPGMDDARPHVRGRPLQHSPPRLLAEVAAAEVFVDRMHSCGVRAHDLAARCWTRSLTRHQFEGPRREVWRRYELAPPFWPLTVHRGAAGLTGYGVNREAVCVQYQQIKLPPAGPGSAATAERVEIVPQLRQLMRFASARNPALVYEPLTPQYAIHIVKEYLVDAAISLIEGSGPLRIDDDTRLAGR